jgi:hypothetical protein
MGESIEALRTWRLFDDRFQLGLMDKQAIEEDLVPGLRLLAEEYSQGESIGLIFQRRLTKLVEESKKVGKSLFGKLERSREPKLDKESLNELIYVGSFHNAFIQIARRGPVTETADTQVTDVYFTEFLETYLPPQDANEYNGSDQGNLNGPHFPPELGGVDDRLRERLEIRMVMPYLVDAHAWRSRWERLDTIPDLWEALGRENVGEGAIQQLRGIAGIARYALDNHLSMLKMFV